MRKVTLLFTDERDLRRFTQTVTSSYLEMIASELTLTCECDEAEIELAERGFNAKVIKVETNPS